MTDIRRHYLRSAIGVACGLLAAVAIIGLLADFGSAPLSGRSTNGEAGRDTAAISPVETGGESAIMSLHDAPRPMPALQFKEDRKSTRLNSSHSCEPRMPTSS